MFYINTDDKEIGWCPPSDSSWKIYVNSRRWTSDHQESKPTYDQAEHFLRFIDKYVNHAVGKHYFLQWSKLNRTKPFLDKVTASDIVYTILVHENTKEVWEEDLQIKVSSKDDMEQCHATCHKKSNYLTSQKVLQWLNRRWARLLPRNCWGSSRTSSQALSGKHYKNIRNCIRRNILQKVIIKMMTKGHLKKNVQQVTKMIGK